MSEKGGELAFHLSRCSRQNTVTSSRVVFSISVVGGGRTDHPVRVEGTVTLQLCIRQFFQLVLAQRKGLELLKRGQEFWRFLIRAQKVSALNEKNGRKGLVNWQ